jgi:hypothetical protein
MLFEPFSSYISAKLIDYGIQKIYQQKIAENIYHRLREFYYDILITINFNKTEKRYRKNLVYRDNIPSSIIPYINIPYTKNAQKYLLEKLISFLIYSKSQDLMLQWTIAKLFKQLYPDIYFQKFGYTASELKVQENIESFFKNSYTLKITDWC